MYANPSVHVKKRRPKGNNFWSLHGVFAWCIWHLHYFSTSVNFLMVLNFLIAINCLISVISIVNRMFVYFLNHCRCAQAIETSTTMRMLLNNSGQTDQMGVDAYGLMSSTYHHQHSTASTMQTSAITEYSITHMHTCLLVTHICKLNKAQRV